LYEQPASLFVSDFIGDANIIEAAMGPHAGDTAPVSVGKVTQQLKHRGVKPGKVKVAIRPESLLLIGARPNGPALDGRVAKAAYLGTHMEYTVTTELGDLFVVDRAVERPLAAGAEVFVTLAEHGTTVIPA
jgi:iron(III) transport system ATP-binding protein